jgi:hypothetical protein
MAPESVEQLGRPDVALASPWVSLDELTTLNGNGYKFLRIRITFELGADQTVHDPLPSIENVRIRFVF